METINKIKVTQATIDHKDFIDEICRLIEESAKIRGTGIAKRDPKYIEQKMNEGKGVIAIHESGQLAGFCYIESWGEKKNYIANSGLIVSPDFRGIGLGNMIKESAFELSRKKFPEAKLFGITTSPAVMKINYDLGYRPVTFRQLTDDELFWNGCKGCTNYDILMRTERHHCLCTAMLYDPDEIKKRKNKKKNKE
jgi:hypothetical protein